MASVNVTNVVVLDNPSTFTKPFQFEITFECLKQLADDLEWKVIYVGSAESEKHDQVLDSVLVGPVPLGVSRFVLEAPSPDAGKIPTTDLLGVTVVLLTCSYRGREFIRVGYYVSNSMPGMDTTTPASAGGIDIEEEEEEEEEDDEDEEGNTSEAHTGSEAEGDHPAAAAAAAAAAGQRVELDKVQRVVIADKPRVTRFAIDWDN